MIPRRKEYFEFSFAFGMVFMIFISNGDNQRLNSLPKMMKTVWKRSQTRLLALGLCFSVVAAPVPAQCGVISDILEAFGKWMQGRSSPTPTSPTSPTSNDPTADENTPGAVEAPANPAPPPQPSELASIIAGDAGGHPDQYTLYSDKLADTLAGFSADQRGRIFGGGK